MKVAIFSDTHDNTENILKLIRLLNKIKIDYAFFCGDICSPFSIELFKNLEVNKLFVVFGNNDGDKLSLIKHMPKNAKYFNYFGEVKINNKKIFITHFDFVGKAVTLTNKYDFVFFGHSHKKEVIESSKTLAINPGEILGYFGKPSFCILNLESKEYSFYNI
ncbi:MAG: YfcE family phosphodiesterase [Candidatus Aenigmatarchaeota archaeon]